MPIWLSPGGPKFKVGTNMEVISYQSSPDYLGRVATEIVVWLPGLVAVDCGSEMFLYLIWLLSVYILSLLESKAG